MARQNIVNLVSNRLRINNDVRIRPDILNGRISRPLIVVGLPRCGTTLLHRLLAQDPDGRPLLFWESAFPSPPPDPETYKSDPRIRAAERTIGLLYRALPDLESVHRIDPKGPEECLGLLMNTFVTPFFLGPLPQYRAWLADVGDEELAVAYREYREQLLLLQWKIPARHWVLKCPSHLFGLKALLETFPDACVVQTHRDPLKAIPSLCSLNDMLCRLTMTTVDSKETGRIVIEILDQIMTRSIKVRKGGDGGRVYDVHYKDLVSDPLGTVRKIYGYFGYDMSSAMEENIKEYLSHDRKRRQRVHHYGLDQFHLERAEIERRFSDYYERFQIEHER